MNPTPTPLSMKVLGYVYIATMAGTLTFGVLWLSSPGFRYWLFRQGRELQYRWALWEYAMRTEPIPEWAQKMNTEPQTPLPDE
jgi:hypothetical protein